MSGSKIRGNSPMEILKFLQIVQLKCSKPAGKAAGFTLIELLVGIVLAFLVIAPLLGFVVNMMNTDRREQAKATSEQELQAAADYISRDLQQAVYIYDATGVSKISSGLPPVTGTSISPVLVFWKRKFLEQAISADGRSVCTAGSTNCNDAFVYALVAYYLTVPGNNTNAAPWSGAAQIRRLEIQDGVKVEDPGTRKQKYLSENDPKIGRDKGFNFNLSKLTGPNLTGKMNSWKPGRIDPRNNASDRLVAETITNIPQVLVDYIDRSPSTTSNLPKENCPPIDGTNADRRDPTWQRVPRYTADPPGRVTPPPPTAPVALQTYSFFACVYSSKNTAQVFLRGNALARIQPNNRVPTYDRRNSAFFPTARIQATGSGRLRIQ
jgi:type II secretory pathway pseudopilin PulG